MKTNRNTGNRQREAGFSLLELMVVAALLALLAAVVIPRLDFQRADLEGARAELQTQLRYLRGEALSSGRIHRLRFVMQSRDSVFERLGEEGVFEPVQDSLAMPRRLPVDRMISVATVGGSRQAIQVMPGGWVQPALIEVEVQQQIYTLSVHALTGKVEARPGKAQER